MQSLSLDLQSADKPSVCEMLNWLAKAVKDARTAVKRHPAGGTLTSRLLYIPAADVLQLKVGRSCDKSRQNVFYVYCNS